MNKTFTFFKFLIIACIFPVFLSSCGEKGKVKQVAKDFLQAYYIENDFEKAKEFSTIETYNTLDTKALLFAMTPNSESEQIQSFKIKKVEISEDKKHAACHYMVLDQERTLLLSLTDGKWLVDMPENMSVEPALSLSQSANAGGFASATSAPIRLRDVPREGDTAKKAK